MQQQLTTITKGYGRHQRTIPVVKISIPGCPDLFRPVDNHFESTGSLKKQGGWGELHAHCDSLVHSTPKKVSKKKSNANYHRRPATGVQHSCSSTGMRRDVQLSPKGWHSYMKPGRAKGRGYGKSECWKNSRKNRYKDPK